MLDNDFYKLHGCALEQGTTWDEYHFNIAEMVSTKSKDPHTKVGAVVVGPAHEIRTTGYNSFPRGIDDDNDARKQRPEKYLWIEHAERNAIYNAAYMGTALQGCTLYCQWIPCMDCARAIVQAGIAQVVVHERYRDYWEGSGKWTEHMRRAVVLFSEAGVKVKIVIDEPDGA